MDKDVADNILLIVQAMQLIVVALIVVITFDPKTKDLIDRDSLKFVWRLRLITNRNPLLFISLGFLANFISLLLSVVFNFSIPISGETQKNLVFSFNMLNTCFFTIQFLPFLRFSKDKKFFPSKSTPAKIDFLTWEMIVIVIISTITVLIWVSNLGSKPDIYVSTFYFFGSLGFTWYLYNLMSIHHKKRQVDIPRLLVFLGCGIWTLLQFWRQIGNYYSFTEQSIEIVGYSTSLLAKFSIFCGLYIFINRYKNIQIEEKNDELETTNKKLTKKNTQLGKIQNLISVVHNTKSLNKLAQEVVIHLTNKEVFDFDYAIFSEVNYLEQEIIYSASKTENNEMKDVSKWARKEAFRFDDSDIMAQVVKVGKTIHARGKILDGKAIDMNSETPVLDYETYTENDHQNLNRFYIPLKIPQNSNFNQNRVVAVIEVGYYIKYISPSSESHKTKEKIKNKEELELYVSNCAQSYERLFEQYVDKKTVKLLENCENLSKYDHLTYLQEVLNATCELINTKFGFITLVEVNKTFWSPSLANDKEKSQIEDLLKLFLKKGKNSSDTIKVNRSKLEQEMSKSIGVESIKACEIGYQESTIGYMFMLGKNKKRFNEIDDLILEKISANIGVTYNEKKFHNAVASLVIPNNAITDLETNLQPLIEALKKYFETPHISIWRKERKDKLEYYVQKYASFELKAGCETFNNEILIDDINLDNDYEYIDLNFISKNDKNALFKGYGQRNNLKTLLRKPLKTHHQIFGFIHIYFKRERIDVTQEDKKADKTFLNYEDKNFLDLIAIKALTTIQIHELVSAFRKISDSFTQNNLDDTLKRITDTAMNLLNADPVILYKSSDGENIFCSDITFSYKADFREKEILTLLKKQKKVHVDIAEGIIKYGSKFFNDRTEYEDYLRKHSILRKKLNFEKDFWHREEIQSSAAVKLVHKTENYIKPVGVMFINFRNKVDFHNDEIKSLINTFAAFASGSIYNGFIFERNREYLLRNLRMAKPLIAEVLAAGALHDAHKKFKAITSMYFHLINDMDDQGYGNKKTSLVDVRAELKEMETPIRKLFKKFNELSTLYRPEQELQIKTCNVVKLINEQLSSLKNELDEKLIRVHDKYSDKDILIDCDESLIGNVLFNIISNAYQAMDKRGNLEIRLEEIKDDKVKIDIIDDGKGINDDIKEIITEPYVTDKPSGTGLGLAMSKLTIDQHRGHLKFHTKNKKTTFSILLPKSINQTL